MHVLLVIVCLLSLAGHTKQKKGRGKVKDVDPNEIAHETVLQAESIRQAGESQRIARDFETALATFQEALSLDQSNSKVRAYSFCMPRVLLSQSACALSPPLAVLNPQPTKTTKITVCSHLSHRRTGRLDAFS